jgi:hypothetical protein
MYPKHGFIAIPVQKLFRGTQGGTNLTGGPRGIIVGLLPEGMSARNEISLC